MKPKVKQLVWRDTSYKNSFPDRFVAKMPCGSGDYSLAGSKSTGRWNWYRNGYYVDGDSRSKLSEVDAKAAAQADYERRILDALE